MITHLELALIAVLLVPQAIEKAHGHIRPILNWLERRRVHKAWEVQQK